MLNDWTLFIDTLKSIRLLKTARMRVAERIGKERNHFFIILVYSSLYVKGVTHPLVILANSVQCCEKVKNMMWFFKTRYCCNLRLFSHPSILSFSYYTETLDDGSGRGKDISWHEVLSICPFSLYSLCSGFLFPFANLF